MCFSFLLYFFPLSFMLTYQLFSFLLLLLFELIELLLVLLFELLLLLLMYCFHVFSLCFFLLSPHFLLLFLCLLVLGCEVENGLLMLLLRTRHACTHPHTDRQIGKHSDRQT